MNYDEIIESAKAYSDRRDIEVLDQIDTFIRMAEAHINRVLKTREQSTRSFTPLISNQSYYPLPPDYRGMRDVKVTSSSPLSDHKSYNLNYLSPSQMTMQSSKDFSGERFYTIIANQIQIWPAPSKNGGAIESSYYQKVPSLKSNVGIKIGEIDPSTNWLLEEHPDIYLSGICAEIEAFAKNVELANAWKSRMVDAIFELQQTDIEERWTSEPLQIRIEQ